MQLFLLGHQLVDRFLVHFIGHTTVDRAYRSALRLFMESLAFGALIWNNVICIDANGAVPLIGIHGRSVHKRKAAFHRSAIAERPFHPTLVNSVIGTFRLAGAAIDAFICYLDRHILQFFTVCEAINLQQI